jgi:hypothetical protein
MSGHAARGYLITIALLSSACATFPKMDDGAPLKVKRGYWALPTEFEQRGHQVDRGSVKDVLSKHEQSAAAVQRAGAFDQ